MGSYWRIHSLAVAVVTDKNVIHAHTVGNFHSNLAWTSSLSGGEEGSLCFCLNRKQGRRGWVHFRFVLGWKHDYVALCWYLLAIKCYWFLDKQLLACLTGSCWLQCICCSHYLQYGVFYNIINRIEMITFFFVCKNNYSTLLEFLKWKMVYVICKKTHVPFF